MFTTTSSIDRTTPGTVRVTVSIVGMSGADEAALILHNGGVHSPSIDLASVISSVTNRQSAAPDFRDVTSGASYGIELRVRNADEPENGDYLQEEADALAPLLVLALEELLYAVAMAAEPERVVTSVPLVQSWGHAKACALPAPYYVHITPLGGDGKIYNNTSRITWQGSNTIAEDDVISLPEVNYNYEGDLSISTVDDFGIPFPDGPRRNFPGNWPGGIVRVDGVDTRRADVYFTGVRIESGSSRPAAQELCRLDMRYATKYKYNMHYAEVLLHDAAYDAPVNRLFNHLYGGPPLPLEPEERKRLLAELAATLPPDGPYPPVGPPFYRDGSTTRRPINLFNVRDGYFTLRKVYEERFDIEVLNDPNDVVYDPNINDYDFPYRRRYYQKLVKEDTGWDPTEGFDMRKLAGALFYPPVSANRLRLRENKPFDVYLRCTQHRYRITYVSDVIDPPGATPGDTGSSYVIVTGDPFWGNTQMEVYATAGGCGVNCAGS